MLGLKFARNRLIRKQKRHRTLSLLKQNNPNQKRTLFTQTKEKQNNLEVEKEEKLVRKGNHVRKRKEKHVRREKLVRKRNHVREENHVREDDVNK